MDAEQRKFSTRSAWLKARKEGIGGSDAAAVLGKDPWTSPLELYAEKTGAMNGKETNEFMRWGQIMEAPIARFYAKETKRKLENPGLSIFRSKRYPFQQASLDRIITYDVHGVLEVKLTGRYSEKELKEQLPLHFLIQGQHELAVTGLPLVSFAICLEGRKLLWMDIPRDDNFIEALTEAEERFWERVQKGMPPDPDASESATKALAAMYPKDSGSEIFLPIEALQWDQEIKDAKEEVAKWERIKTEHENFIKQAIGDATRGILPDKSAAYSWRSVHKEAYSVAATDYRQFRRVKA